MNPVQVLLTGQQYIDLLKATVIVTFVAAWCGWLVGAGITQLLRSLVIVLWRRYRRDLRRRAFGIHGIDL